MNPDTNVQHAVPFLRVTNINASLDFYVQGLGFTITRKWEPEGKIRWCWLELGHAALMLQESPLHSPASKLGQGVTVYFICKDALAIYREARARGVSADRPFVGNGMWVTEMKDPDGYHITFESQTDAPEESLYEEDRTGDLPANQPRQ